MSHDRAYAHAQPLDDPRVPTRTKLSALWIATMFLYVYVDIVGFYEPGTIDGILAGRVWTLDITPAWALGALILMAVPILMVALSVVLPAGAARWTNLVVAPLFVVVSLGNAIGETWLYYWVGAVVEAALLLLVVRYAWAWPYAPSSRTHATP
jgi:hypothetical protein